MVCWWSCSVPGPGLRSGGTEARTRPPAIPIARATRGPSEGQEGATECPRTRHLDRRPGPWYQKGRAEATEVFQLGFLPKLGSQSSEVRRYDLGGGGNQGRLGRPS